MYKYVVDGDYIQHYTGGILNHHFGTKSWVLGVIAKRTHDETLQ